MSSMLVKLFWENETDWTKILIHYVGNYMKKHIDITCGHCQQEKNII